MQSSSVSLSNSSVPINNELNSSITKTSSGCSKISILAFGIFLMSAGYFIDNSKLSKSFITVGLLLTITSLFARTFQTKPSHLLLIESEVKEEGSSHARLVDLKSIKPPEETEFKRVFSFLSNNYGYCEDFKPKSNDPLNNVEQLALEAWTSEFYTEMNTVAKGEDSNDQITRINQIAIYALSKLPIDPNQHQLRRAATFSVKEIQTKFKPSKIFINDRFMSTSHIGGAATKGSVQFFIKGETGRNIKAYSQHPEENEVLFPPGTKFLIDKVHSANSELWEIHMSEVV